MKKTSQFLSVALAILLILPTFFALPVKVGATEPAIGYHVAYSAAAYGDLLYKANLKSGTSGVWTPGTAWCGMTAVAASDGSSVSLEPVTGADPRGCVWRGELNTNDYTAIGASYTVTFTLDASNDDQYVGFYPDWRSGFVITPGQKKVSVGKNVADQAPNLTAIAGETTYTGGGDGAQTYAVEFAVNKSYNCTTYKLYVEDGGQWKLIRELNESQRGQLNWSANDPETVLAFFRNPVDGQLGETVTVSDLNVYRGLCIVPPATSYAAARDGELLYHANFRGTPGVWEPEVGWSGMSFTRTADSVTLTPVNGGDKRGCAFRKALDTTNYRANGASYTVTFTLSGSNDDQYVGFFPDWASGFIITPGQKKASVGKTVAGQTPNLTAIAGETTYTGGGDGKQTYAVEFAVNNSYVCTTYKLYVRDGGQWKPVLELNASQRGQLNWSAGDFETVLAFFRNPVEGQLNQTVTVEDLNVYRGLCAADAIAQATVAYEDAGNRDLLYQADFHGTLGVWAPQSKWAGMDATVAADGSSVTLKPNQTLADINHSAWGGALDPDVYTAVGSSYTVTFTLDASDANQFVGFYPDWFSGFVFTPGQKKVSFGQWGDKNLLDGIGNVVYEGGGNGAQTYAVEFAVSDRKNGDFYVCTTYRLYVFDAGQWKPICELNANQRGKMQWSDTDPEVALRFFRSPTEDGQSGTVTVSDLNVYRGFYARSSIWTATGAAVRLGDPTGLRFTGYVEKDYLDGLKATYGEENVKVGMLITPTDYLSANSLAFTKAALDGCGAISGAKYVKIKATTITDDGDDYKFNCVLSNVLEANYSRKFSAITYVEVNGSTYYYSPYNETMNARSIALIAELALLDLSDTQEYEYQYEVDGKYSPYTEAQRTTLSGFRRSVTVMTYNIEGYDGGWEGRTPSKVIQTVTDESPDVVGLQEVDTYWNSYFSALTSNGYTRIQGDTSQNSWPELLYKTAKFTKLGSGYMRYSALQSTYPGVPKNGADPSRDKKGRMFTWAKLQDKNTGETILAISTHLHLHIDSYDTENNSTENTLLRQYEIRLMLAWIADQTGYDAIVVVGDMNTHYLSGNGKTTIGIFKDDGFAVTYDAALVKGDTGGTLAESDRTERPEWIFDYILTKGNAENVYYTVVDNRNDNGNTSYPSDHVPVMATIVFD